MLIPDARWQWTLVHTLYTVVRNVVFCISAHKFRQVRRFSKDMLDRVSKTGVDLCDTCFPHGVDKEILRDNKEYLWN